MADSAESDSSREDLGNLRPLAETSTARGARRGKLVLLALASIALLACAAVGVWLVRGTLPAVTEAQLTAAEEKWEQNKPDNYDLEVELGGSSPGVFLLEVRQGRVQTAPTRDGVPVRSRPAWETWTVPGQFETIRRELELAADPEGEMNATAGERLVLRGEFDAKYGYPRHYHRIALGGGPEVEWRVKRFEAK